MTRHASQWYSAHIDTFCRDGLPPRERWPTFLLDLPQLRYPARLNVGAALLDDALSAFGDRPCIHTDGGVWTYADVAERSNRIAHVLVDDMGLVPGNRVLLRGPNTPELIACWFAILKAGGVAVATVPQLRAGELAEIIERAQVTHALTDARIARDLERAAHEHSVLREVMTFGPGGELSDRLHGTSPEFAAIDTASDDVALIAFTSGTTGGPKGCMHFHRDLLAICDTYARHVVGPEPDDVFIATPPLAFTFGLGGLVLFPLRFGASTVPLERFGARPLLEAMRTRKVTTLFTAPTAYRTLLAEGGVSELPSLRTCVAAGEPLPAATLDAWLERTGIRLLDGIGSTEMLHIFVSSTKEHLKPGATGRPVPGYQAMIVDDDMRPLEPGMVGRLAVRGPTGCRYLSDPRQADYVIDGWNLTGDMYRMDDDGYFWFQGRSDDMIVSSGYNISGPEVEGALLEHPAVSECAVVAWPDEARGNVVKAFVVVAGGFDGDEALVEALQHHVRSRIAPYKYPRSIAFVDELPRTPTGKIQRFRLRELERSG